ncbi:polysaccharide deacetylase family protein [Sutcliffiella halmapala]
MSRHKNRKRVKKWELRVIVALMVTVILFIPTNLPLGQTAGKIEAPTTNKDMPPSLKHVGKKAEFPHKVLSGSTIKKELENVTPKEELQLDGKSIFLTFDDGPNNATEALLDVLSKYDATATFFMLEPLIKKNDELVRRMMEEGHSLALHGVTHDQHLFYASKQSVLDEMNRTQKAIRDITGKDSNLIRTPYGSMPHMTPEYIMAIEKEGYLMWDWNVDSMDWYYRGEDYVDETMQQIRQLEESDITPIVLLHDLVTTVEYLPQLLDTLIDKGYTFKGLTEEMQPVQFQ